MSASLVGSEMCIRDRRRSERGGLRRGLQEVGGGLRGAAIHGGPGGAPVSYTHLTLPTICSV
eukprot:7602498-Alexandrium_andersonii.AAC.1